MRKVINFLKENKLAVLSVAVFVLVAIFLALPGQYAHFGLTSGSKGVEYAVKLGGYEAIFNTGKDTLGNTLGQKVIGSGIAIIAMIPFAIALICLNKKSSFFLLLAALFNITIAILFFCMEKSIYQAYRNPPLFENFEGYYFAGWVPYVCGALVMLAGLYFGYKAVIMMKNEVKHPTQSKGPSYSYLKK